MKLQDYAHYYIGATFWTNNSQGEVNKVTLQYIIEMIERDKGVQLQLRRLEDMTEKEGIEMFGADRYWDIVCKEGKWDLFSSKEFHYLLQQGFDLFGLIPAGLAVDIKTIIQ